MSRQENDRIECCGADFTPRMGPDGLIACIVADVADNSVLMLGYMNRLALDRTLETGLVHFHSRSRNALWCKGETSGNVLKVHEIRVDCDQDALLVLAIPAGPTCHTGARSCFYRRLDGGRLEAVATQEGD